MMRILIADDHVILRQGLKQILEDEFDQPQFGEAGTTGETLQLLQKEPWDVIILDINMPGRTGLDVLDETRRNYPHLPVLVLSSTPEDQLAIRVLKAGAKGFLNKQSAAEELVNAIRKVIDGNLYITAAQGERLALGLNRGADRLPHELLTTRELQIIRILVTGKSVKEAASELSLNVKTISTYRSRAFEKLKVHNIVELINYVQQHGLMGEKLQPA